MAHLKIGKMVMSSLFRQPATLMYPIKPRVWMERTRGRIAIDIDTCIFCGICARKCPADAITVMRDAKSWTISRMGCVQCNSCVEVCPKGCLKSEAGYTPPGTEKVVDKYVKPEPVEEPSVEATKEPEAAEPVKEAAVEPAAEPVKEAAEEPAAEPAKEAAEEPAAEPVKEAAEEPAEVAEEAAEEAAAEESAKEPTEEPAKADPE